VQSRLIERYSVQAAQVTAEGVGFLSPRATNITEDGRNTNRRVEVVLISAS
jgi:outer membrane protein OmpA-like peptidoglycan-associated protein